MADIIKLEDIQDLQITKKFVRIESSKYADDAYNYVKSLIDNERAILFDKDTHRIYTLGEFYGGDTLKENLLYFSKLLNIDIDNNIISLIDATKNEDNISLKGTDGIQITFKDGNIIEFKCDLSNIIENTKPTYIEGKDNTEYYIGINENGKIDLQKYIKPTFKFEKVYLEFIPNKSIYELNIPYTYEGTSDINNVSLIYEALNCNVISNDKENKLLKINTTIIDKNSKIKINCNDGIFENSTIVLIEWKQFCYYGTQSNNVFNQIGNYIINNESIDNELIIEQHQNETGYFMCPQTYKPIFIDGITLTQGAWHKLSTYKDINYIRYAVYVTDNENLGKIKWIVKNKNI